MRYIWIFKSYARGKLRQTYFFSLALDKIYKNNNNVIVCKKFRIKSF